SVRSVRRGSSVTAGVTHLRLLVGPAGGSEAGGGSPPGATCCGSMGAVSWLIAPLPQESVRRPKAGQSPSDATVVPILLQGCGAVRLRHMKAGTRVSVRDALRLRAAAIQVLARRQPDSPLAGCSAGTWQVFLRTERCALALKARLEVRDSHIEAAATRELQRILSARGHLLRIGQLAAAHHMPAIVLKGGVAALTSTAPVDLNDVDVLVRPPDAERLACDAPRRVGRCVTGDRAPKGCAAAP